MAGQGKGSNSSSLLLVVGLGVLALLVLGSQRVSALSDDSVRTLAPAVGGLLLLAGVLLMLVVVLLRALWGFAWHYFMPARLPRTLALLRADNKTVNLARWTPRVIWWRSRWRWGHWTIVLRMPTDFTISMLNANLEAIRMELGVEPTFEEIPGWRCKLVQATVLTGSRRPALGYADAYERFPEPEA